MLNDNPNQQGQTGAIGGPGDDIVEGSFGTISGSVPVASAPGTVKAAEVTPMISRDYGLKERYSLRAKLSNRMLVFFGIILISALLVGGIAWFFSSRKDAPPSSQNNQATSVDTPSFLGTQTDNNSAIDPTRKLAINGQLKVNNSLVISPTGEPVNPELGQIYLNQKDGKLYFYNGQRFVEIGTTAATSAVGLQGPAGADGIQGPAGINGINGLKGDKGDTGDTGPQGPAGVGSCPNGNCVSLQVVSPGVQEVGNLNVSGTIIAGAFSGNGSAVTNVNAATLGGNSAAFFTNASNLSSGTVSDSRLSTNVTLQGNTFNGNSQLVQTTVGGALPVISGANLTSLNASNISSGTISDARLSANVTVQGNTFNGVNQLVQLNGSGYLPALNGSLLTNVDAATLGGQAGSYYTNASNISSGTLSDSRLSANVTLQGNTFNGASQLVQLNASTQLPAISGALLTNLNGSSISSGTVSNTYLTGSGALTVTAGNGLINGGSVSLGGSTTLNVGAGDGITVNANDIAVDSTVCRTSNNCTAVGAASGDLTGSFPGPTIASLQGKTLTISGGTPTTGAVLQYNGTAFVDGLLTNTNLTAGTYSNITGTGALTAGSIGGSFGNINIGSNTFTGNGSGLTNLNASNVSSGTLNDARLSVNVTTQGNTFNGISQLVQTNGSGFLPALNGSLLTNVDAATLNGQAGSYYTNASNISSGTLNDLRLSSNVTLQGNTFNGNSQLVQTTAGGALPTLSGINLTNLNASSIASGTLNDARLSTNVTLQGNTFNGISQLVQLNGSGYLPALNASLLTNINASNIASGTLNDARLSANVTLQGNTFNGVNQLVQLDGSGYLPALNGSALTNINASNVSSGTLSDSRLSANVTVQGNTFNGVNQLVQLDGSGFLPALNGSALTSLNASNISSGTLNDARLSSNVALLNGTGPQTFTGDNTFTGLLTANGDLTLQTGDTFTVNGDALTDLTGSGLTVSGGALTVDTTTSTGFFRNGGNSFAGPATLGTNDANVLNLETNNTDRFQISASASTLTGQGSTTLTSTGSLALTSAAASNLNISSGAGGATNINSGGQVSLSSSNGYSIDVVTGTTGVLTLDSGTTGGVNLGTGANAKAINVGNSSVASTVSLQGGGGINIGTGGVANTIQVGNTSGAVTQTINIGNNSTASSVNNINIGSSVAGTTAIQGPTTITGRTSGSSSTLIVDNSTSTGSIFVARDNGTAVLSVPNNGGLTLRTVGSDSATALNLSNSGSERVFNVGTSAGSGQANLIKNSSFEPSGSTAGWSPKNGGQVGASMGGDVVTGDWIMSVTMDNIDEGFSYAVTLNPSTDYTFSAYVRSDGMNTLVLGHQDQSGTDIDDCVLSSTSIGGTFQRVSCSFTTGGTISGSNVYIKQSDATNRNVDVDAAQLQESATLTAYNMGDIYFNAPINKNLIVAANPYIGSSTPNFQVQDSTGNLQFGVSANNGFVTVAGDLQVNGGDLTSTDTTFNLLQSTVTTLNIGGAVGAGGINFAGGSASSGCTINGSNGNLTCSGNITSTATSGTQGWWTRSGTTLQPATAGDNITTTGTMTGDVVNATTTLQLGGIDINTAGVLSNVAYLDGSGPQIFTGDNTFTGAFVANGTFLAQSTTNSTTAFQIQNASSDQLLGVDTATTPNLIANSNFEIDASGWAGHGSASVSSTTTQHYIGSSSLQVDTYVAGDGAEYAVGMNSSTSYTFSFFAKLDNTSLNQFNSMNVGYSEDGATETADCLTSQSVSTAGWTRYSCTFTTGTVSGSPYVYIKQTSSTARTFYIDGAQLEPTTAITNLISNSDFETNITGWGNYSSPTLSQSSTQAYTGSKSLKMVTSGGGGTVGTTYFYPMTADTEYTVKLYAKLDAASASANFTIGRFTNMGQVGTDSNCASGAPSYTSWTLYTCTFKTGSSLYPSGSLYITFHQASNLSTPITVYIDNASMYIDSVNSPFTLGKINLNGVIESPTVFQNSSNSLTAFQIQDASARSNLFVADTINTRIGIGTATPAYTLDVNGDVNVSSNSAYRINGVDINTAGTLNNVAYLNQANTFKTATNSTTAFQVQNSAGDSLLSIDNATTPNLITNPSFEVNTTGWAQRTSATLTQITSQNYTGKGSMQVVTGAAANNGVKYAYNMASSTQYSFSFYAKAGGTFTTMQVGRSDNGTTGSETNCLTGQTVSTTVWTRYTCTFTTGTTSGARYVYIKQSDASAHTYYIDGAQLEAAASSTNFKLGNVSLEGIINSHVMVQNATDSTTAFQVQNAAGSTTVLNVDTINGRLGVGTATPAYALDVVGTANASTSVLTPLVDTASAVALNIGTTNATGINLNQNTTVASNKSFTANGSALFQNATNSTTAFQIQNAATEQVLNVNTSTTPNLITNSSIEVNTTGWASKISATITRDTTEHYVGNASLKVATAATSNDGVKYAYSLTSNTTYTFSFHAKLDAASAALTTMAVGWSNDGSTDLNCLVTQTVLKTGWTKYTCTFTTGTTSGSPYIYIKQTNAAAKTFYVDGLQLEAGSYGTNLVSNPDFETNTTGWTPYNSANLTRTTSQANTGTASMQIDSSGSDAGNEGALYYINNLVPNTQYTFKLYIRLDAGSPATTFGLKRFVDNAGEQSCTGSTPTISSSSWQLWQCTFTTDAGAPFSNSYVAFVQTNNLDQVVTSYIDDVSVTPLVANPYTLAQVALNGVVVSPTVFQGSANSTTAFQIQNASGSQLLVADTINGRIAINQPKASYTLDVGGSINSSTGYYIKGSQISSSNLSDYSNLAKLNGNQAFGAGSINVFNGTTLLAGNTAVGTLYGGLTVNGLSSPYTAINVVGTGGSSTWNYSVVAVAADGTTSAPSVTSTGSGNTTLDSNNYNRVDITNVTGAISYRVYRTSSGGTPATTGLIGSVTASYTVGTTFNDTGLAGDGSPAPSSDTSAHLTVNGTGLFKNAVDSTSAFQIQNSAGTSNLLVADTTNTRIGIGASPATSLLTVGTNTTTAAGGITFGTDTNLYRGAADTLKTDDSLLVKTSSTSAFQIQSSGSSSALFNADTTNMRVSVGSIGTATGQLYVSGSIPSGTAGSVSAGSGSYVSLVVKGSYAYLIDYGGNTLQIVDVSKSPTMTAKGTVTGPGSVLYGLVVEGRYAYSTDVYSGSIVIFDVSDPSNPTVVSNTVVATDIGSTYFGSKQSIVIQGRYAYVTSPSDGNIVVVDISNPLYPTVVGTTPYSSNSPSLVVQGSYLYIVDSSNNSLDIFSISNPTSPVSVGTVGLSGTLPVGFSVSGSYAYIVNIGSPALLRIYDISNPSTPAFTGSVSVGSNLAAVTVSGRYAYVGSISAGFKTVDISNPSSPTSLGGPSGSIVDISSQGRYAYTVNGNGNLYAYDLGGAYIQRLRVGDAQLEGLSVDGNTDIGGNLYVRSGLNIDGSTKLNGDVGVSGNALYQSTTNSTEAFRIQNTTGQSLFQVDTLNNKITIGGNNSGELAAWGTTTSLPATRQKHSTVVMNGYMYMIGGSTSAAVRYAKVNANGTLGSWSTASTYDLPNARQEAVVVAANGYIYVIGGYDGSAAVKTVYYAKANPDGTLGAWRTDSPDIPAVRSDAAGFVANGYVYVTGGADNTPTVQSTVYYAKLNANGTTGAWSTNSGGIGGVGATRALHTAVAANGYVYIVGGVDAAATTWDTVGYGKLNLDGSITGWSSGTVIPGARDRHTTVIANGYMYVIGGESTYGGTKQSTVYYAYLYNDGTLGSWYTAANALPTALMDQASTAANGYVYSLGGNNGSVISTVYYSSLARVQVGGALDLVGLSRGTMADGESAVGGELTSGNTNVVGFLQVAGNANFSQSVAVGGELNVAGNVALGTGLVVSGVADGASAVGFTLNTANTFSTAGSKVLSVQNNSTEVFSIDKVGNVVTFGHIKSYQATKPTIGTPSSCGASPTGTVANNSTDSAGSFTITAGTGSPGNCAAVISFINAYGTAPKSVLITPASATGSAKDIYVSTTATGSFTVTMNTAPAASEANTYYYWVIE